MPAKWSKKMSKQKKRPQMTTASSRALKPSRSSDTHLCDTQCSDTQKSPRPSHNTQLHYFLNLPRLGPKHSATEIQWRSLISCLHSWVDEFFCNFSKEMIVLQTWKAGRVCVCVCEFIGVGRVEGGEGVLPQTTNYNSAYANKLSPQKIPHLSCRKCCCCFYQNTGSSTVKFC